MKPIRPVAQNMHPRLHPTCKRDFFIDNLLVRIHFIIVMIRWTGLAPWEFKYPTYKNHPPPVGEVTLCRSHIRK